MRFDSVFFEVYQGLTMVGTLGTICSVLAILFFIFKKEPSAVPLTYAIGSLIAFLIGNSYFSADFILRITLGNVIGVVGGYLLLLLSLIQCLLDKKHKTVD